jgi:hypothetical protein
MILVVDRVMHRMMMDRVMMMTYRMMYRVVNRSVRLGRHRHACDG